VELGLTGEVRRRGGGEESGREAHKAVGMEEEVGGGEEAREGGRGECEVGARRREVGGEEGEVGGEEAEVGGEGEERRGGGAEREEVGEEERVPAEHLGAEVAAEEADGVLQLLGTGGGEAG